DTGRWNKLIRNKQYPLLNRATQGTYAPGSIFKIVTAAAALKEGIVNQDTRFYCPGSYKLGNRKFRCWRRGGHGWVNLHQALVESCDVYFYNIAEKLGINRFAKYIKAFGFGNPTGIDLNERKGVAPSREWKVTTQKKPWYIGETIVTGIGQGYISTTPLQVSLMTASIANGGTLLKPQIVKKVISPEGEIIIETIPDSNGHIPVDQNVAKHIMDALIGVVNDPRGTGRGSRLESMLVAGKTGTAQVISLDSKSDWNSHRDHAWFTSYVPADNPEIAVTVIVEHGGKGGAVAAPIVRQILKAYQKLKEDGQVG
ncbi:MAG: penicillin-binding transpeptidase domain-containing protein, partial [Thermodesulfobacteriota bacterium]